MIFSLSPTTSPFIQLDNVRVLLDGITEVSVSNVRTTTLHPVETGSNITDAQHQQPIEMSFRAWITDTPQSLIDSRVFTNLPNVLGAQLVESHTKIQLEKLEKAVNQGKLATVKTKYAEYNDYYLTSFSYSETSNSGLLINFSIRERQDDSVEDRTTASFSPDIGLWS
jgi:hypothetical protein